MGDTSSYSSLSSLSTLETEHPADSAVDMDDSMIWFDDDNDLDLALDDVRILRISSLSTGTSIRVPRNVAGEKVFPLFTYS